MKGFYVHFPAEGAELAREEPLGDGRCLMCAHASPSISAQSQLSRIVTVASAISARYASAFG